jgi:hypothetical protein
VRHAARLCGISQRFRLRVQNHARLENEFFNRIGRLPTFAGDWTRISAIDPVLPVINGCFGRRQRTD